jgi:predicted enzyme related to lactoylglutathione lyase
MTFYQNSFYSNHHQAKEFYRSLFGWEFQSKKVDNATYEMIQSGDKPSGGLMQMTPEEVSKIPAHWMTYVYVNSVDDSVAKAQKLGAKVIVPPTAVEDYGRFAILQDPAGAHIGLWQCTKSCS